MTEKRDRQAKTVCPRMDTKKTQRKPNLLRVFLVCLRGQFAVALCVTLACAFGFAFLQFQANAQSGRVKREEDKRPIKPVPPPPIIKPPSERPASKPKEDEAIRINNDLVTVITTALPPLGEQLMPLIREDFEILEDGVTQEITNFGRESEAPLQLVMLFDSSLSVAGRLAFEKKAAENFFKRVIRPQDRAAIFAVSTNVELMQEFTNRVPLLINATRQLKAQGATSLYDGIYLSANYLKPVDGRRIIVLVTDGGDTTSMKTLKLALKQAQAVDAVIYAVYTGNLWNSRNLQDLAAERALLALTSETGGQMYRPKIEAPQRSEDDELSLQELDNTFLRLADELRTQYVLGFYSNNERRDGSYRKLTIRLTKPGYTTRARAGYYAPKDN